MAREVAKEAGTPSTQQVELISGEPWLTMLSITPRKLFKAAILKGVGIIMTQQVASFFLPTRQVKCIVLAIVSTN